MFDNLSKFLAQEYSRDFATWLIGKPIKLTELKPTELSLEPIRADSVILLKSRGLISHTEFQTDPDPDTALSDNMQYNSAGQINYYHETIFY